MAKILIVGCGALGYELAKLLAETGHDVTGLKRNPPPQHQEKFTFFKADITSASDLKALDTDFGHVFFIVSPGNRNEANYHDIYETGINNLIKHLASPQNPASWIIVSSTSVYGQNQGEWVDEDSPAIGSNATSRLIVAAEQKLFGLNPANIVVRFSGIYGPGREYLLRMARQTPSVQRDPPYYTNRIHQRDCVGTLAYLLEQRLAGTKLEQCYLASDDSPAPLWDVMYWLTAQMHCAPPTAKIADHQTDMNKRCQNERLKKLGYRFIYPDFKAGYLPLIQSSEQTHN